MAALKELARLMTRGVYKMGIRMGPTGPTILFGARIWRSGAREREDGLRLFRALACLFSCRPKVDDSEKLDNRSWQSVEHFE
jgi:hypothetical protein